MTAKRGLRVGTQYIHNTAWREFCWQLLAKGDHLLGAAAGCTWNYVEMQSKSVVIARALLLNKSA